jgi:DNA-binding response OmpR family regulator
LNSIMARLLLFDPDPDRRLLAWDRLVEEGHDVQLAEAPKQAQTRALSGGVDLAILDGAGGNGSGGLALCAELRRVGYEGAVILVTAAAGAPERVRALRAGADDVLTRPLELAELVARVEACLRRGRCVVPALARPLRFGSVELDLHGARVLKDGRPVPITPCEFRMLRCLVERAGTPVSRVELLDSAWGPEAAPSPQTVDVHVAWLRSKLEADPRRPALIRTVRRVGYIWAPADPSG